MDGISTRQNALSPVQQYVCDIVADMETAFATGSQSRVLTSMTSHAPYASDPAFLVRSMRNMPMLGWSCWDMSALLAHLLNSQGIEAGLTIAFGAEASAPAVPHSLVRVIDDDNEVFYSEPYFGVGVISRASTRWVSRTVHAVLSSPDRHYNTSVLTVDHKSHTRDYAYHILPGVLTPEQLEGALWQAESFNNSRRYLRGVGPDFIWLIKRNDQDDDMSTCSQWTLDYVTHEPEIITGNWFKLIERVEELSSDNRTKALERVFNRPPL